MDFVYRVPQLPRWNQAVQASFFAMLPGGKGLNQAVAASRLGAEASLITAVGSDEFGNAILETLDTSKVLHDFVIRVPGELTATTNVLVSYQGEAAFVGWKGIASDKVDTALVAKASDLIADSDIVLITLEVSLDAVRTAMDIAKRHSTLVLLNPAPPLDAPLRLSKRLIGEPEFIVPTAWEAQRMVVPGIGDNPLSLAGEIARLGAKTVCIITPEAGCVVASEGKVEEYLPFETYPVDVTGGSDAFCAALAVARIEGRSLDAAIKRAIAACDIVVGHMGASPHMPTNKDIDNLLDTVA